MVKNPLVVTKLTLVGGEGRGVMGTTPQDYVLRDSDVRSSTLIAMPDDGIECKILRGKTFVIEWGICNIMGGMHTTRTKIEVPLSACADAGSCPDEELDLADLCACCNDTVPRPEEARGVSPNRSLAAEWNGTHWAIPANASNQLPQPTPFWHN